MSQRHIIHLEQPGAPIFNFRAAAIIIDRDWVLLHRADVDDFWAPPGGRVELGEAAARSLQREMHEEIGLEVHVERLLWVAESFYTQETHPHHGLCFYFLVHLPACPALSNKHDLFYGQEESPQLEFRWFRCDQLEDFDIRPAFLKTRLRELPASPIHILDIAS